MRWRSRGRCSSAPSVLILDEPTSALGVHQAAVVLRLVAQARARGIGVVFISHNVHHAYVVGDRFTLLNRGRSTGTYAVTPSAATSCLLRWPAARN